MHGKILIEIKISISKICEKNPAWKNIDIKEIKKLHSENKSTYYISKKLGVSQKLINKRLELLNLKPNKRKIKYLDDKLLLKYHQDKYSAYKISKLMNIDIKRIKKRLKMLLQTHK